MGNTCSCENEQDMNLNKQQEMVVNSEAQLANMQKNQIERAKEMGMLTSMEAN